MIKSLIFGFSRVILFPKDKTYTGSLNGLNKELIEKYGENYDFFDYFELNTDLLDYIDSVKSDADCYIFTTDSIQDRSEVHGKLKNLFKDIFRANEMGVEKNKRGAYQIISEKIKVKPNDIFYLDDNLENVNAALDAGIEARQFIANGDVIRTINKFF